jgi:hypothetical protein
MDFRVEESDVLLLFTSKIFVHWQIAQLYLNAQFFLDACAAHLQRSEQTWKQRRINPNLNTAQVPFILTEPSDMLAGPLPRPRGNDRAINCWLGGDIRTLWNFVQSVNRSLLPKHLAI